MSKVNKLTNFAKHRGFSKSINDLDISDRTKQALSDVEAGDYMVIIRLQMEWQREADLEMIAEDRFNWE